MQPHLHLPLLGRQQLDKGVDVVERLLGVDGDLTDFMKKMVKMVDESDDLSEDDLSALLHIAVYKFIPFDYNPKVVKSILKDNNTRILRSLQ
jgi:hypothetical protein